MKFILGEKIAMTQFFDDKGRAHAATIVSAGPAVVTQVKTVANDGYDAVQVGFGSRNAKNINKAQKGAWKDMGNFRHVAEFRIEADQATELAAGTQIAADAFGAGDTIRVSGVSKGKGFQGGVKRHGFKGGPRSHGQKHSEREPGSIGGSGGRAGGRVAKGMRMAGRMGSDLVTVRNLKVLAVDKAGNTIIVKGAVPGKKGTLLRIVAA